VQSSVENHNGFDSQLTYFDSLLLQSLLLQFTIDSLQFTIASVHNCFSSHCFSSQLLQFTIAPIHIRDCFRSQLPCCASQLLQLYSYTCFKSQLLQCTTASVLNCFVSSKPIHWPGATQNLTKNSRMTDMGW